VMRVAIVGQQDFGKAVLEAFLARGDQVAAVFCAPEKEGARPDALRAAAQEQGLKVHQFKSLRAPEALQAMLEAADLVAAGKQKEVVQDESQASYEGWFREAEARINWANHADTIHNLIRGCDPAPGAWTTLEGVKLQLFDGRKELVRTFGAVKGKVGEVVELAEGRLVIAAQGGRIHVGKAKLGDGKKLAAAELVASGTLKPGLILGN